jgi:cobalt/nickel transport system ATP-binding protein
MTAITRHTVQAPPALLVVGHGSRDADGVEEFWTLAEAIRNASGDLPLDFGFIEMAEPLVDEALDRLVAAGASRIVSIPLVLLAAGHLKNDGPAALARARLRHPEVEFGMGRDLGIDPVVLDVAEERIRSALGEDDPSEAAVVLVGRGSSDPDAGSDLFKLARLLADGRGLPMIEPGFAGVAQPDVPAALERCRRLGARTIVVAPFLLFTGVLVPRIYQSAAEWAKQHPELAVRGAEHLGPDRRLARVVLERYREVLQGEVRMNCDLCTYRVRLPGYEDKLGMPISLTPHGDGPARGKRRARRATRVPTTAPPVAPRVGLRPAAIRTPDPAEPPAVDVRRLSFTYPDGTAALHDLSFEISEGERVAILGANGAGKTTLLLHLNGMLEGGSGEVSIGGSALTPGASCERRSASSSRTQTTSCSCRPSRPTSRSARPTSGCATGRSVSASRRRCTRCGSPIRPSALRNCCRPASAAGPRSRGCWRCTPRCSCSTSRPRTLTPRLAGSWSTCCARCG